jgi:hypothetical protein
VGWGSGSAAPLAFSLMTHGASILVLGGLVDPWNIMAIHFLEGVVCYDIGGSLRAPAHHTAWK